MRAAGHTADTVWDEGLSGASDAKLAEICLREQRAMITMDLDFSDIRVYAPDRFYGIIVMRLQQQDKRHVLKVLERLLPLFSKEKLQGHLWIVEEKRVRIR